MGLIYLTKEQLKENIRQAQVDILESEDLTIVMNCAEECEQDICEKAVKNLKAKLRREHGR